jgi:hypothetical protein
MVPYNTNSIYYDAWNGEPLTPQINGTNVYLTLSIPPGSAGCVVQEEVPAVSVSQSKINLALNWSGGKLQQSTNLANRSWPDMTNVASPLNPGRQTNSQSFFEVKQ